MSNVVVVAIDGPSGSGKSSTSRAVAEHFGWAYLDTGAMYRAMAWAWLESGLPIEQADAVAAMVRNVRLEVGTDPAAPTIHVDGTDVTATIREPRISTEVSKVSSIQQVRDDLIARQRAAIAAAPDGIVVEGRDITTVVAPDADLRILLVADPRARVARRAAELGEAATGAEVTDQVIRRDRDDSKVTTFTEAAEGVTVIDSTHDDLPTVVARVVDLVEQVLVEKP
ncbi:cytidylate kinase [Raineyella antarctica]|uniref:Cytidylate kinase n=1 Tax=Raineyella antarctica TaxID=1577474 RepID=A0A1G6HK78_9ACTN|nr:(d)CMP kinase [Raineyella antarctica]SDB93826.1 cytidylate kinase [Raineyella antarctica]